MELANAFVANTARWRLADSTGSDPATSPILQASLAFAPDTGLRITSATRPESQECAAHRRLVEGRLRLRPDSTAKTLLICRARGGEVQCTIESTLPRAQFDWLASLVDQPDCSVQLEFALPESALEADANGDAVTPLDSSRFWVTRTCADGGIERAPLAPQAPAAEPQSGKPITGDLRPPLDQTAAKLLAQLLTLHPTLSDFFASVTAAVAQKSAKASHEGDRTETSRSRFAARPSSVPQVRAADGASEHPVAKTRPPASIPTAAPPEPGAEACAATDGRSDDELTLPDAGGPGWVRPPVWADDCALVGSMASPALPGSTRAADTSAVEGAASQSARPQSPSEAGGAPPSLVPETLAANSPGVTWPRLLRSQAPRLAIAALLVVVVGGYWISDRGAESVRNTEAASATNAPGAVDGQPALPSSPAADVDAKTAAVAAAQGSDANSGRTRTSPAPESADAAGLSVPAAGGAHGASASNPPHAESPVESKEKRGPATTARKSSPAPAGKSQGNDRAEGPNRKPEAPARSATTEPRPMAPMAPIIDASPAVKTAMQPPIREAHLKLPALAAAPSACSHLRGLKHAQCQSCEWQVPVSRLRCERSVKIQYCNGKWGKAPDCPWTWTSAENAIDDVRP